MNRWMMRRTWSLALALAVFFPAFTQAAPTGSTQPPVTATDWPNWRGPEQNGVSRATDLPESWSPEGENLVWKNKELATRSTPIVMNGKLYTLAPADEGTVRAGERVICADAKTGEILWENKFKVFSSDVPAERVAWSNVVGDPETGNIYAQAVAGQFLCIDGKTGKTIWEHSLSEEYGLLTTYGGRTNVPVVFDDLVIISGVMIGWGDMAKPNHRFIAFDKKDGTAVWLNGTRDLPDDTTYSTPILAMINGQPELIGGTGDGTLYSIQPRTGKIIWKSDISMRGLNVTPLLVGDTVFMSQSEENAGDPTKMGTIVAIDAKTGKDLWRHKEIMIGKSTPVYVDGRLYAIDDGGGLFVLDAKTGKTIKKQKIGTMMRSSPLYADGKLYMCDATGRWYIMKPTEKGVETVHKLRLTGESHGSPIAADGRIYIPTTDMMYCIGSKDDVAKYEPAPAAPKEAEISEDPKPAWLQIVPVESITKPGETLKLTARLYNSRGQYIGNAEDVEYSVDQGGTIGKDGVFHAATGVQAAGSVITAKSGSLTGTARVRTFADLPWKFDFNDGQIPLPWIGMRYRHKVGEVDGEKVMIKVTTIPKGTRSQGWIGPVDLHDYTMQADIRGQLANDKIPDIGLIVQRYTLELMGAHQVFRILDWNPVERNVVKIPLEWKGDVWYTMKLRASVEDGKSVLKGKIWVRGEPEPKEWQVESVDELASIKGSPGFYGNAKDAEIYIDNVLVTKNQ